MSKFDCDAVSIESQNKMGLDSGTTLRGMSREFGQRNCAIHKYHTCNSTVDATAQHMHRPTLNLSVVLTLRTFLCLDNVINNTSSLALTGQESVQLDQEGQVDVLGLGSSSVRMLLVLLGERVFSHGE
jgi:hypothetical protein